MTRKKVVFSKVCPKHFVVGSGCTNCVLSQKFEKFPLDVNTEIKQLYSALPAHSSQRRESVNFITETLTKADGTEKGLEAACNTILAKLRDLSSNVKSPIFLPKNMATTPPPSGVINLIEEDDTDHNTLLNRLLTTIPEPAESRKRKNNSHVETLEHNSPTKRLKETSIVRLPSSPIETASFSTIIGRHPSELSYFTSFNIMTNTPAPVTNSPVKSVPPPLTPEVQPKAPPQPATNPSPPSTFSCCTESTPTTQPFTARVVIIPQGAILHDDKKTNTRVLVLQTMEQYTDMLSQLTS
jgi:hypothetical protein